MRILIVSATLREISFLIPTISSAKAGELFSVTDFKHSIDVLITGVGMTMTAFYLGNCLQKNDYDLILNSGLAGAFKRDLQLGDVVNVTVDCFGDLGAEEDETFIDIFKLGLTDKNEFPFEEGKLYAASVYRQQLWYLKSVEGVTVNTVHGNEASISKFNKLYTAEVETMEGAAFMYACLVHQKDCIQLRSISNYVEKRDRSKWNIALALEALQNEVEKFLKNVS